MTSLPAPPLTVVPVVNVRTMNVSSSSPPCASSVAWLLKMPNVSLPASPLIVVANELPRVSLPRVVSIVAGGSVEMIEPNSWPTWKRSLPVPPSIVVTDELSSSANLSSPPSASMNSVSIAVVYSIRSHQRARVQQRDEVAAEQELVGDLGAVEVQRVRAGRCRCRATRTIEPPMPQRLRL